MTKGLTLLETLIAIGIFSFVVMGIFGVLGAGGTHYATNLASINLQRQARQGMSWLCKDVRPASWLSITISAADANGNNRIKFNTPDATGVEYYVESPAVSGETFWQLKRIDSVNITPRVKAKDISVLKFTQEASGNILKIEMTASKTFSSFGKSRTLTFSLTEKVKVRNA